MEKSGFLLVKGDASQGILPAVARHWAMCAVIMIAAQWLLTRFADVTNFGVRLLNVHAFDLLGSNLIAAVSSVSWLIFPFGALALVTWWISKKLDGRGWGALGLTSRSLPGALPWVFAGLFASLPLLAQLALLPSGWIEPTFRALVWLIPATLIQSGAEEILFRGALLAMLVERYGPKAGVLISAALFAAWHVASGQGIIDLSVSLSTTFVFGVTSAILVLHQDHLGGAIALHLIWNLAWSIDAGTAAGGNTLGMTEADFWQSYISNYLSPWTLEALQDPATRGGLVFSLLVETLIVLGACKATASKVFAIREPALGA